MGTILDCFYKREGTSETSPPQEESKPQYSWDLRPKIDPKDFIIDGLHNGIDGRLPGKINGQQFVIQNCENSSIYLFDCINTITIDDCVNCNFYIGPIKTSIFIRDCKDCKFIVSCQQFRTRDCHKLDVYLACVSQPIIESSAKIRFAPYHFYYPELEEHFNQAGLSPFNCIWSDIHDFTPTGEGINFSFLPENSIPTEIIAPLQQLKVTPNGDSLSNGIASMWDKLSIDVKSRNWIVPITHGKRRCDDSNNRCLIIMYYEKNQTKWARMIVNHVLGNNENCVLMETRQTQMNPIHVTQIFGSESYNSLVAKGPVITLDFSGPDITNVCKDALVKILASSYSNYAYITSDPHETLSKLDALYNLVNMQMNTN